MLKISISKVSSYLTSRYGNDSFAMLRAFTINPSSTEQADLYAKLKEECGNIEGTSAPDSAQEITYFLERAICAGLQIQFNDIPEDIPKNKRQITDSPLYNALVKEVGPLNEGEVYLLDACTWMKKSIETQFIDFKKDAPMSKTQTLANYELTIISIKNRTKNLKVISGENIDIDKEFPNYFKTAIENEVNSVVNTAFSEVLNNPRCQTAIKAIKQYIINFYLNPTEDTYKKVSVIPYGYLEYSSFLNKKQNIEKAKFYDSMAGYFVNAIAALNKKLNEQMATDGMYFSFQILTIFTSDELTALGIVPEGK